ncbi:hypothetical protein HK099_007016 [Clydaea vesicula]|uniref:Ras guanine nucleotide exchange factor n=1 Tax=Clydaea vesicula TaxID=447962 RepID=A0AAD5U0I5_9FUNG|nr:hypothetical protein HK099_007016 [Clydaea vesicula]
MDRFGNTALHFAASQGDYPLSYMLLLKGADPNALNKSSISPTTIACRCGHVILLKVLIKHGGVLLSSDEQHAKKIEALELKKKLTKESSKKNLTTNLTSATNTTNTATQNFKTSTFFCQEEGSTGLGVENREKKPSFFEPPLDLQKFFPKKKFHLASAAYLGIAQPLIENLNAMNMNICDENKCSVLMKAAFKGHLEIVQHLLTLGVDVNAKDNQGNTALVWACASKQLETVKCLVEEGNASVNGDNVTNNAPTPLITATFSGSYEVVEYLINKGADPMKMVGGKSPLMIAAWMFHFDIVTLLIDNGTRATFESKEWVKAGVILLRKIALEHNAWTTTYEGGNNSIISKNAPLSTLLAGTPPSPFTPLLAPPSQGISLKEKMSFLTAEEHEKLTKIEILFASPNFNDGQEIKKFIKENFILKKVKLSKTDESVNDLKTKELRKKSVNEEKFFDKMIEISLNSQMDINFSDRGSELDFSCLIVYQCAVQLAIAANKNIKHQYVVISAKAIHYASELIRAIENMENMVMSSPNNLRNFLNKYNEGIVFPNSALQLSVKEKTKLINTETSKQLMLCTRIAVGVWPPPNAITDMINAAYTLAHACKELADLTNLLGFFPLLEKKLDAHIEPFEEELIEVKVTNPSGQMTNISGLNFQEYNKENHLLQMREMSRRYEDGSTNELERSLSTRDLFKEEVEPHQEFIASLDLLLSRLIASVAEVKRAHTSHLKDEFISATAGVASCAESVLAQVQGYEPFLEASDNQLLFEVEDLKQIEESNININLEIQEEMLPTPYKSILAPLYQQITNASKLTLFRGKLAAQELAPLNASLEMIQATIPCLLSVKKLLVFVKQGAGKWQISTSEEKKKRELWRKECLQNERVKNMFQMWENASNVVKKIEFIAPEESAQLQDSKDGLVLIDSSTSPSKYLVKGGEIFKLVSWMTDHSFVDIEFTTIFLMTHHSFMTSLELLDCLIKRYAITPPYGLTKRMFEIYVQEKIVPVRMRVCNVLKIWIEFYFEGDFAQNESLVLYFRDFVENKISLDFQAMTKTLLKTLDFKIGIASKSKSVPPGITNSLHQNNSKPDFILMATDAAVINRLNLDPNNFYEWTEPLEMAKQLTLIDYEQFLRVKSFEMLDQIWGDKRMRELNSSSSGGKIKINHDTMLTGISRMIKQTNHLTWWVTNKVVNNATLKGRITALKYFAQTALVIIKINNYCREMKNFNALTGIVAGLSTAPIFRMKKTWAAFADKFPKTSEAYREVAELVSPSGQYSNYRKTLKEQTPPTIPFLGVYLTDLTMIDIGNSGYLPDSHYINFDKLRKVYAVIKEIQYYQHVSYSLQAIPTIQMVLQQLGTIVEEGPNVMYNQVLIGEDELYDIR